MSSLNVQGNIIGNGTAITNLKCERVNCHAIYDAIISSFKLMYDLIIMCYRKKKTNNKIIFLM